MRMLLLGLLLAGPRSLYELHSAFESGLGLIYAASYGSIHRALRQLLERGDIETVDPDDAPRGRKRYRATAAGERAWRAWMAHPEPGEDGEASTLARVFLLGELPSDDARRATLLALRERAGAELAALREVEAATRGQVAPYPHAVLGYGLTTGTAMVTWLDDLLDDVGGRR